MAALPGYKARIYATATPSITFTNEATTDAGDHKKFTITDQNKRYWEDSSALTVQTTPDGTTWTTVTTGFTPQFVGGVITFDTALTGSAPGVRVSGKYLAYSLVAQGRSIEINHEMEILEKTVFEDNGWKTKIGSLVGSTYKISKWWVDHFFVTALDTRTRLILSAMSDVNGTIRYDAYGYISQDSLKFAINAINSEDLTFEVDGKVYSYL